MLAGIFPNPSIFEVKSKGFWPISFQNCVTQLGGRYTALEALLSLENLGKVPKIRPEL